MNHRTSYYMTDEPHGFISKYTIQFYLYASQLVLDSEIARSQTNWRIWGKCAGKEADPSTGILNEKTHKQSTTLNTWWNRKSTGLTILYKNNNWDLQHHDPSKNITGNSHIDAQPQIYK